MIDGPQTGASGPPLATRARDGRWVAGVCAGLAGVAGLSARQLRIAFCLAALCGGIGLVLYLACWLLFSDPRRDGEEAGNRGAVLLAWAAGGLVIAVLLAAAAALAAALGLGWVVFGVAGLIFLVGVSGRTRLPPPAVVAATAALTLPATAVTLSPVRIALQAGATVSRPVSANEVSSTVYRSGLGTRLVDLRHTRLPASGVVRMRIDAGVRRTIVALPSNRCVHVRVAYNVRTFVSRFAALVSGRYTPPFRDIVLFNRVYGATTAADPSGVATSRGARPGPTLDVTFSSLGGSLFVRNYPDAIDPQTVPDWPGFPVGLEPRPRGSATTRSVIRAWRRRVAVDRVERRTYERDRPGPCARH